MYHLFSQQRLAELKPYSEAKTSLDKNCSLFLQQQPQEGPILKSIKKTILVQLSAKIPSILSEQRLQAVIKESPRNEAIQLNASRWYLRRGDLIHCEQILQAFVSVCRVSCRQFAQGIYSPSLLMAYGEILALRHQSDSLFLLLRQLDQSTSQILQAYLQGVYALECNELYQALEHLNLCLSLQPQSIPAWTAIGRVRSALVGVYVKSEG